MKTSNESSEKKKVSLTHAKALLRMNQPIEFRFLDSALTTPEYFRTTIKNIEDLKFLTTIHPKGTAYYASIPDKETASETDNEKSSESTN